ncbi:restriction endonuclease subunit S [Vibrio parahaemolyticus]
MTSSVKFSEIAELVMGQSPKGADCNETGDGFPLLNGPTEFTERSPLPVQFTTAGKKFSKTGDILFCVRGSTTGRMNYADQAYAIGRGIGAIRGINGYPTAYIRAVLEHNLDRLLVAATGSTFPNVGKDLLNNFEVNVCSPEQAQQANKLLVGIEDKRYLNSQTNQTLEEMAQAIFKSWFVDFDPVKAKINGDKPEGMDEATASLFPEKLVESELGLIPDGWEVTKLSKVIDLLNGFAFKSSDYVKEGTFVLRTKNFDSSNSVERLGDDVYLPDEFLESHKKYLCEAYDYHVVMVAASIGKTAMIYPHQLPALRNQNMWCFRPKDESLRFYTKYMVDGLVKLNMGLASGSARAFFKKGDFNSYEFALPSSELLTKFNDVVGNLVRQKGSLLNQNVQLAAMRDTLLPKLLSGEIELVEQS